MGEFYLNFAKKSVNPVLNVQLFQNHNLLDRDSGYSPFRKISRNIQLNYGETHFGLDLLRSIADEYIEGRYLIFGVKSGNNQAFILRGFEKYYGKQRDIATDFLNELADIGIITSHYWPGTLGKPDQSVIGSQGGSEIEITALCGSSYSFSNFTNLKIKTEPHSFESPNNSHRDLLHNLIEKLLEQEFFRGTKYEIH